MGHLRRRSRRPHGRPCSDDSAARMPPSSVSSRVSGAIPTSRSRLAPSRDVCRRLLREFNDTAAAVPQQCAHELIARWALSAPDRTAVLDDESSLTYAELDARANQLAHRLRASAVGPEVGVGLCTDRSIEM